MDGPRKSSVADPGCLSRIPDPDFFPSRIPDPKKNGEVKKFFISVFLPYCSFPLLLKQFLTHNCCTEFIQFNNYFELFSFFNPRKYWL
jgi:hypothetical protein